MFKKINLQLVISYLGLLPFLIIIIDNFFFKFFDSNIVNKFSIFYSIIIFVFIGAMNWNLKKNLPFFLILLGFFPSILSVFIVILFLYSQTVIHYIIILFIIQLVLDNFNYKEQNDRLIYFILRVPLTFFIILFLIIIQLQF